MEQRPEAAFGLESGEVPAGRKMAAHGGARRSGRRAVRAASGGGAWPGGPRLGLAAGRIKESCCCEREREIEGDGIG